MRCDNPTCSCNKVKRADDIGKQDRFVNQMKEAASRDLERYEGTIGMAGNTIGVDERMRGLRQPQYTPLLVQTMFELYCFPDKRRELLCYQDRPSAVREVMSLLERASIVHAGPNGFTVDEDALRAYVNAVCSISLPTKSWEVR